MDKAEPIDEGEAEKPAAEPEGQLPEPLAWEVERSAADRAAAFGEDSEPEPRDWARQRLIRAVLGLVGLLAFGLAFLVWENVFQCDPRNPWDMQLGCVLRPEPTPEPFPLGGVSQFTFDAQHYKDLKWSPAGDQLLAVRCEVIHQLGECSGTVEPVLIDLETGEVNRLGFDWYVTDASAISFNSATWSLDGERILLDFTERFNSTPASRATPAYSTESTYAWRRIDLDPDTGEYRGIETGDVWPLVWYEDESLVFGRLIGDYDPETGESIDAFGWYDYRTGIWEAELQLSSRSIGATEIISPDRKTLLIGDDLGNSSCRGRVLTFELGSDGGSGEMAGLCFPVFSSNGTKLAFSRPKEGDIWPYGVWIAEPDGSDPQPLFLVDSPMSTSSIAWSPDGMQIAFTYGYNYNAVYVMDVPEHLRP